MAFDPKCFRRAVEAANSVISEDEVRKAFAALEERNEKLRASGSGAGRDEKMRRFAAEEAERTRIAGAMQRRHAAINILKRQQNLESIRAQVAAGRTRAQGLEARLLGTQAGVVGGRDSFVAAEAGFVDKYIDAGLMADMLRERPHIQHLLEDKAFDRDVTLEMAEIKKGGNPGVTGNSDARFVAEKIEQYSELARTDANKRGAAIGKLEGRFGRQTHDPDRMLSDSMDNWRRFFIANLDMERTFPEGATEAEVNSILEETYRTITTGFARRKRSAAEKGDRTGPASLAKSLGKERVYHFKNADAAMAYRERYGHGNTIEGALNELRRMAHINAAMEEFGTNPETNIAQIVETLERDISEDASLTDQQRAEQTRELEDGWGKLKYGIDVVTGLASTPKNIKFATFMGELRTLQIFGKLGAMLLAQMGDTITPAIAAAFRGSNPFSAWGDQMAGLMRTVPRGELADVTYLLGEATDGMVGHIINAHAADDVRLGFLAKRAHNFFKWNGSTWFTDRTRGAAVRTISAEMAMHAGRSDWAGLKPQYRHFLTLHNIDDVRWEAIRKASARIADGRAYITPDRINELPDAAIEPIIADKIAAARVKGNENAVAALIDDARDDLVMAVRKLFADETNYAILQTDASSRMFATGMTRPGSPVGEAVRMTMQFKGYPIAFTQRVLGRAMFGRRKDAGAGETAAHWGTLIGGLMLAGYVSMTAKDLAKGYWPPRDPLDYRTILAAGLQSGALGIYGDYLFGEKDRFGGGLAESVLGPTIGGVIGAVEIAKDARDYFLGALGGREDPMSGSSALNFAVGNNPVWLLNLPYTRPALDFLILNSLREMASPGYMKRRDRNRMRDYGQTQTRPFGLGVDPLNLTRAF